MTIKIIEYNKELKLPNIPLFKIFIEPTPEQRLSHYGCDGIIIQLSRHRGSSPKIPPKIICSKCGRKVGKKIARQLLADSTTLKKNYLPNQIIVDFLPAGECLEKKINFYFGEKSNEKSNDAITNRTFSYYTWVRTKLMTLEPLKPNKNIKMYHNTKAYSIAYAPLKSTKKSSKLSKLVKKPHLSTKK